MRGLGGKRNACHQKADANLLLALCMVICFVPSMAYASGPAEEDPILVPQEGLVIEKETYYGISKEWFKANNPDKETMSLAVKIPSNVTTIAKDGFIDSYTSEKKSKGAVTYRKNG